MTAMRASILLLLALVATSCGGGGAMDGRYTCGESGLSFIFRPDGSVDEQRRAEGLHYVVDGEAVTIVRDPQKDIAGTNIRYEFRLDGGRLVGAKNENFICQKADRNAGGESSSATPTSTEAVYVGVERAGTQPVEIMTLRLGDTPDAVASKLAALPKPLPFLDARQDMPGIQEKQEIRYGDATDTVAVIFSPPPQRAVRIERRWQSATAISWPKMLESLEAKHGPKSENARGTAQWFLGETDRAMNPPPYARECDLEDESRYPDERCGRLLAYFAGYNQGTTNMFTARLADAKAWKESSQAWSAYETARQKQAAAQAEAGARSNDLPPQ